MNSNRESCRIDCKTTGRTACAVDKEMKVMRWRYWAWKVLSETMFQRYNISDKVIVMKAEKRQRDSITIIDLCLFFYSVMWVFSDLSFPGISEEANAIKGTVIWRLTWETNLLGDTNEYDSWAILFIAESRAEQMQFSVLFATKQSTFSAQHDAQILFRLVLREHRQNMFCFVWSRLGIC